MKLIILAVVFFIISTVFLLIKRKRWILELTVLHVSFFFFLTFMVKSVHPVEPVEPFLDRYYIANLPTMSLVIIAALQALLPRKIISCVFKRKVAFSIAGTTIVMMLAVTALPLPSSALRFIPRLTHLSEHPIPKFLDFVAIVEKATEDSIPMISIDTSKPLDTVNRVFYDNTLKGITADKIESVNFNGHSIYYLQNGGKSLCLNNPEQKVLWCSRFNFDIHIFSLGEIPSLSDSYSSDL